MSRRICHIFAFLHFVLALSLCTAQVQQAADSLRRSIARAEADSSRALLYLELGKLYLNSQPDTAQACFERALQIAQAADFAKGIARSKSRMAYIHIYRSNFDQAFRLCAEAIPIFDSLNLKRDLFIVYNNLGTAWNVKGNHWMAIDYFQKCLELAGEATLPPRFLNAVNNNLGQLYNDLRLFERGLTYSLQAYEMASMQQDEESLGIAAQNIGNAFDNLHQPDSALKYYRQAVAIAQHIQHKFLYVTALTNVANILLEQGELQEARRLYQESLEVAQANEDLYGLMNSYSGLSDVAFRQRAFEQAEAYAQKALALGQQMKAIDYTFSIYLSLSDIALVKGDMNKWQYYRQLHFTTRDSVSNVALVHAIQELESKYETRQKEQQILQLTQQGEIQQLQLRQKNTLIAVATVLLLLFLILGVLGFRNFRQRELLRQQENALQAKTILQLEQEKQLASADAMLQGQEQERARLARELHDGLGGLLSGIKQSLFTMKGDQIISENDASTLNRVVEELDYSMTELRRIARNMMPEALVKFGLKDALEDYCGHIREVSGMEVHFQAYGMQARLPQQVELIFFRLVQELLNNILRHAAATEAMVQLLRDGNRLNLTVEDNGRGFDPALLEKAPGIGWLNIRSRVKYLNGQLELHSLPGKGTSVNIECTLP